MPETDTKPFTPNDLPTDGVLPSDGIVHLAGPQVAQPIFGRPCAAVGRHAEPDSEVIDQGEPQREPLQLIPAPWNHGFAAKSEGLFQSDSDGVAYVRKAAVQGYECAQFLQRLLTIGVDPQL